MPRVPTRSAAKRATRSAATESTTTAAPDGDGDGIVNYTIASGNINLQDPLTGAPIDWAALSNTSANPVDGRIKLNPSVNKRTETSWLLRFNDNYTGSHYAKVFGNPTNGWTVIPDPAFGTVSFHNNWAQQTDVGVCTPSQLVWTVSGSGS